MHRIAEMVAGIRLDEVEHRMVHNPEDYPAYSDGIEAERIIIKTLLEKYEMDKVELDQLVGAVNASGAALAVEMYIEGFLDGGHVAMAFQHKEMPGEEVIVAPCPDGAGQCMARGML